MARRGGATILSEVEVAGGFAVIVVDEGDRIDVWLDRQSLGNKSGTKIGTGSTERTAVNDALSTLRAASTAIEEGIREK
jgi:hypothetical protein